MLFYIRYTQGLGDAAIYTRLRNATGEFWDFTNEVWVAVETTDCRTYLLERDDLDSTDSLYSAPATLPAGGPWVEEVILLSTARVLGYDDTSVPIESTQITLRQMLFGYIGDASNVFSKVCGSFVGTIDFYTCSYTAFADDMEDPGGTFICKLNSSGVMLDETDTAYADDSLPVVDGDVLYFTLPSTFSCLTATVVNLYNAANTGSIRIYVAKDLGYVAVITAYYPTTESGLLVYENSQLISLGETAYGKAIGMIPNINWTNISQPVQLTTTTVVV